MAFDRQRYERQINAMYVDLIAAADESGGAPCTDAPDLFFPEDSDDPLVQEISAIAAKAICARCPVIQACKDFAIHSNQKFGVWGGLTTPERLGE